VDITKLQGKKLLHYNHLTASFPGRMPFLPPNQQRQSTEGTMQGIKLQHFYFVICITGNSVVQEIQAVL